MIDVKRLEGALKKGKLQYEKKIKALKEKIDKASGRMGEIKRASEKTKRINKAKQVKLLEADTEIKKLRKELGEVSRSFERSAKSCWEKVKKIVARILKASKWIGSKIGKTLIGRILFKLVPFVIPSLNIVAMAITAYDLVLFLIDLSAEYERRAKKMVKEIEPYRNHDTLLQIITGGMYSRWTNGDYELF